MKKTQAEQFEIWRGRIAEFEVILNSLNDFKTTVAHEREVGRRTALLAAGKDALVEQDEETGNSPLQNSTDDLIPKESLASSTHGRNTPVIDKEEGEAD